MGILQGIDTIYLHDCCIEISIGTAHILPLARFFRFLSSFAFLFLTISLSSTLPCPFENDERLFRGYPGVFRLVYPTRTMLTPLSLSLSLPYSSRVIRESSRIRRSKNNTPGLRIARETKLRTAATSPPHYSATLVSQRPRSRVPLNLLSSLLISMYYLHYYILYVHSRTSKCVPYVSSVMQRRDQVQHRGKPRFSGTYSLYGLCTTSMEMLMVCDFARPQIPVHTFVQVDSQLITLEK